MTRLLCLALCLAFVSCEIRAQEDEIQYGLIGAYQENGHAPVEQLDGDLLFAWTNGGPHPLIPEKFQASWRGQVLIQSVTKHRFYAQLNGFVTVKVGGKEVLQGGADKTGWISGPEVDLSPGFQPFNVTYRSGAKGGVLKVYWSSEEFDLEPLPAHLLFHEEDDAGVKLVERGRQLFESHRCHRCHEGIADPDLLPAPALWGITNGTNPDWILEKLQGKNAEAASDKMPHFGLSAEEADCIAQYLHRLGIPKDLVTAPDVKVDQKGPQPRELLYSLGCLGCHRIGALGNTGPYSAHDLTQIGAKRSRDWLATWLASPERINPQHRMPVFQLSRSERGLLTLALSQLGARPDARFNVSDRFIPTDKVQRGAELVKQLRCANCHKIPAIEADRSGYSRLQSSVRDWEKSCLADAPDPDRKRPHYPQADRGALRAYLSSQWDQQREPVSSFVQGQRVLLRRNCLGCHKRGTENGLAEQAGQIAKDIAELKGQSQVLIPPSLTAIGDKLRDDVLDKALSGEQERARADWLKVRMPKFQHSVHDLAALKTFLVEHDRLPGEAAPSIPQVELASDDTLLLGRQLIGAGGFSCIACHQVGDYVPKNVALGTRGSDLQKIGSRLRPEFFYRWCRGPLRIVPGMEMPSYRKAVPGLLADDVQRQLAVVWSAVNDPRFEAPTNPTQVEQFWQLASGDRPRVVRDVFTVDAANGGGAVPRAFAVGFANQHALLLDLDQASLREWRYGDFARQRAEGKSWYWDLAGAHVVTGLTGEADFVLMRSSDQVVVPWEATDASRLARLRSYTVDGKSVTLHWSIETQVDGQPVSLTMQERLEPVTSEARTGWASDLQVQGIPSGYRFGRAWPTAVTKRFDAQVARINSSPENTIATSGRTVFLAEQQEGTAHLSLTWTAEASLPPTPPVVFTQVPASAQPVTSMPGYTGTRLRIPASIMPTAIAWDSRGRLVFTSLKGHVYRAVDTDTDGLEDSLQVIEEGLAAPFGILADGDDLLVIHKPELLRLKDLDGDGRCDERVIVADGWGYTDNYHDWVTGPVRGPDGHLMLATGSDYSHPDRDLKHARWRGKILEVEGDGRVSPYAHELRYPIGMAVDAQGRLFVSDQQGVQNTFNEIDLIVPDGRYGVPARLDPESSEQSLPGTIQIPHPWTRSVNGIFFLPAGTDHPFAGHGVGCEYNGRFLIRFSVQVVEGVTQGAVYPLSRQEGVPDEEKFVGPICGAVGPGGEIVIGSIYDSGWLGGRNTGEIVRLQQTGPLPGGIREVRAVEDGFAIEFVHPIDPAAALKSENYSVTGYTRKWKGSYATDDSDRHSPKLNHLTVSADNRTITMNVDPLREGFVYEIRVGKIGTDGQELFPDFATYTLHRRVPQRTQ